MVFNRSHAAQASDEVNFSDASFCNLDFYLKKVNGLLPLCAHNRLGRAIPQCPGSAPLGQNL
jgi:hypothetical protein